MVKDQTFSGFFCNLPVRKIKPTAVLMLNFLMNILKATIWNKGFDFLGAGGGERMYGICSKNKFLDDDLRHFFTPEKYLKVL